MTTDSAHDHPHIEPADLGHLLDLDGEVFQAYLAELTAWLGDLSDRLPRHIVDLASGTGTGSFALARQFPNATVTALDLSPQMLDRLRKQASRLGLDGRVRGLRADLDEPWPRMEPADLVWAASALHHLNDPDRAFTEALRALRPGGLMAATEMDFFPRFLPADVGVGRPGLESRIHAALNTRPPLDWSAQLAGAGFVPVATRRFVIELKAPLPPATGQYAHASLSRLRAHATGELPPDDAAALDALLDDQNPLGVRRRADLTVRTTRTTWVVSRP